LQQKARAVLPEAAALSEAAAIFIFLFCDRKLENPGARGCLLALTNCTERKIYSMSCSNNNGNILDAADATAAITACSADCSPAICI